MSHYVALVLVESQHQTDEEIQMRVADLLSAFDENTQVEPYERECDCIGSLACYEAARAVEEAGEAGRIKPIDDLRREWATLPEDQRTKDRWQAMTHVAQRIYDDTVWQSPNRNKPNPECTVCGGTGTHKSTYNPISKWDWWRIGGRWDGWVHGAWRESVDGGFNFGAEHEQVAFNSTHVSDLLARDELPVPFAVLTPDGVWHEKGQMHWLAIVKNPKQSADWEAEVRTLYEQHRDCLAVAVDCHI